MTYLSHLKDKNIVVLGAGITGISCARFLHRHGLTFTINDSRANIFNFDELPHFLATATCIQGEWHTALIAKADVLLVSPGIDLTVPAIADAISADCDVIGDVELYCRCINAQVDNTAILAVTGSNGKSTVVSLLEYTGKELGYNVALGGNIGLPVLDRLTDKEKQVDVLILELSSFQLETLSSMKAIAATVLNVSDDHLDRHKTLENYAAIKQKVYQQSQSVIFNRDDLLTQQSDFSNKEKNNSQMVSFGLNEPKSEQFGIQTYQQKKYLAYGEKRLALLASLPLAGMHNAMNYLAVLALGNAAGWPITDMILAFEGFKGLAHRCQRIETNGGVQWINDSKATNVGASLAAIDGLAPMIATENKLILIAGGDGKGADFSPLKAAIEESVSKVITIGKDGQAIAELTSKGVVAETLTEAVALAKSIAVAGDMVLLSPACASIDMFKNYEQRGQLFIDAVTAFEAGKVQ